MNLKKSLKALNISRMSSQINIDNYLNFEHLFEFYNQDLLDPNCQRKVNVNERLLYSSPVYGIIANFNEKQKLKQKQSDILNGMFVFDLGCSL